MATTIQEIARILDLSHATVSRVLNNRPDRFISDATRERVLHKASELGYRPNRAARALVTGRTGQIALWMGSVARPVLYTAYYAKAIYELEELVNASEYQLLMGVLPYGATEDWAAAWHADGYLICEGASHVKLLPPAGSSGVPCAVCFGGSDVQAAGVDSVVCDLFPGAMSALRHLHGVSRKRIAFVGAVFEGPRHDAYLRFTTETGRAEEYVRVPSPSRGDAKQAVRAYLKGGNPADALYCFNDDYAIASYCAAREIGLKVPDDLAITGCDGIEDTEYLEVPLTTIRFPMAEMCRLAWEMLVQRIESPDAPVLTVSLPTELVIRASTLDASSRTYSTISN